MSQKIRVIVTLDLSEYAGTRSTLIDDLVETVARSREEPGCLSYEILQSVDRPDVAIISELWESAEIYDAHHRGRIEYFRQNPEKPFGPHSAPGLRANFEFYPHTEYVMGTGRGSFVPKDESLRIDAIEWAG